MPAPYADILFWAAVTATAIAQFFILRSTARGMRGVTAQRGGRTALEWMWAILPAVSLLALFAWTWRTIHPSVPRTPTANVTAVSRVSPERS